ncbi:uncharacterized protein EV154DRAFT_601530 [Mucor mucedo]|uniref:uncharacterized protein n=1 Tax=Mucor mucedo TaxID=29922 RepID=UPI00222105B9|nr:uncharacterized protein EV154DRAFT_601530 [Mucor mucedo]KAI7892653.1 hypothetical protein EV154DRAFT_601530 [Mucor mucedo]
MNYHWRFFAFVLPALSVCVYDSSLCYPKTVQFYFVVAVCIYVIRKELEQYFNRKNAVHTPPVAITPSPSPRPIRRPQSPINNTIKFRSNISYFSLFPIIAAGPTFRAHLTSEEQFTASIAEINGWLKGASQPTLLYSREDQPGTRALCRQLLVQLFTQHRSTRLHAMLNYMNTSITFEDDPYILARALTNLVLRALNIPHNIGLYKGSNHRSIDKLLTSTLIAAQDSLVCDFILYNLMHHDQVDTLLNQDINETTGRNSMVNIKKKQSLPIFTGIPFMTPLPSPSTFEFFERTFGLFRPDQEHLSVQSALVKDSIETTLDKIDRLHSLLWNKNTRRLLACISPPILPEQEVGRDPLFFQIEAIPSPPGGSRVPTPGEIKFYFTESEPIHVDADTDDTSWPYVNYRRLHPEDRGLLTYGTTPAIFEDSIVPLRATQILVMKHLRKLLGSKEFTLYNHLHALSKAGYAYDDAENDLNRIRNSLHMLELNYRTFQDRLQEYEKGFVIHQLSNYVKMFQSEVECVETANMRRRAEGAHRLVFPIRKIGALTKSVAWNLKYVLERFTKFDHAYKKPAYRRLVHNMYRTISDNVDNLTFGNNRD